MKFKKYDLVMALLAPRKGSEQKSFRPCLVVQNNPANESQLKTVLIAPLTNNTNQTPSGIIVDASDNNGLKEKSRIELTQIRCIDKLRITKNLGVLEKEYQEILKQKITLLFDLEDLFI